MKFIERTLPTDIAPSSSLRERILSSRGADPSETPEIAALLRPDTLKGLSEAARAIVDTIDRHGHICIVGDYDADGATATAIAIRGLRMFGADVSFIVPNRFTDGYGLSATLVERAAERNPALIVTVDNGIAAVSGIAAANDRGIPVVVTDHHLAGDELPDAVAIVNPNQPGCDFPSKALAGCGVMFYVLIAMRRLYRERGDDRAGAPLNTLFDILALGTVADVVQLDRNNRILVSAGLERIRAGKSCPGIRYLFDVASRPIASAGAMDLGFYIGPRINAAGRMDDASVGIQCLITDDEDEALVLAQTLNQTNAERKAVQADIEREAELVAESITGTDDFSLVVAGPEWHEGVIGIVAGRLKEKFRRPAIVFAAGEEGFLKGSCRSIPALHMRDVLDAVDRRLPGVILRFGGHAMAAGLSIRAESFEAFRDAFEEQVRNRLAPSDLEEIVEHDGPLRAEDLTVENAEWIRRGVWGQGFAAPSFLTPARVVGLRILKDKHSKLTLEVDKVRIDAILFNRIVDDTPEVTVHGRLEVNEWNGRKSVQLLLSHVLA